MTFYRAFSILLTNTSHTGLLACILSFTIVAGSLLVHTSELEGGAHQKKGEVAYAGRHVIVVIISLVENSI